MGFGNQLRLLLWKNFTLRKRQPIRVVVELVWPLCLFFILVAVKTRPGLLDKYKECHFDGRAMPSAGTLPFLQTYLCTFNNTCHQTVTADEITGTVDNFNQSLITRVLTDLEKVLANNTDREEIFRFLEDLENLQQVAGIIRNGTSIGSIRVGNLLVDPERLRQRVTNQSIALTQDALNTLLNASLSIRNVIGSGNILGNLVEFLNNFTVPTGGSLNATLDTLRERICNESFLHTWFNFSSPEAATELQTQLCNLSATQVRELYEDFREEFSVEKTFEEVAQYVFNNTGKKPNFNYDSFLRLGRIFNDVRDLESLTFLWKDLGRLVRDLRGLNSGSQNGTSLFGTLVCGRSGSFLSSDEENNGIFGGNDKKNNGGSQGGSGGSSSSSSSKSGSGGKGSNKETTRKKDELNGVTSFCTDIFRTFESSSMTRILWRQIKPIILGDILYSPDTPVTRKIIKEANATFENLATLIRIADDWTNDLSPRLHNYLNNSATIDSLRDFTEGTGCRTLLILLRNLGSQGGGNIPNFNISTCESLGRFLYNGPNMTGYDWRDALNFTDTIVAEMKKYLQCFKFNKFKPHASEVDLTKAGLELIENNTFWAALIFDVKGNTSDLPSYVSYKIRMDADKVDSTKHIMSKYWRAGPRRRPGIDTKYYTYGFDFLQDMVDHAIIRLQTGVSEEVGVYLQQFPYPCYVRDRFVYAISRTLPMFMVIAWIYTVAMIVKGIVHEKERRLKEVMKIMGLGNGVHWMAWFINAFVMMLATVILLVIVLKGGKIMEYSDASVIFVFMLAFTVSTIMQCFMISVFFSRANLAAVCGGFIYFILYLPYTQVVQWEEFLSTSEKMLTCLSSSIAFGFGCGYISRYEEQMVGVQWYNIAESPLMEDDFNMALCILMMFVDAVIYGIVTWYIEAVFPGEFGIPRPWYFPVQRSYWCGIKYRGDSSYPGAAEASAMEMNCNRDNVEEEPVDRTLGVAIRNLKKIYSTGKKVAVDGLSMNFYEGQITSFLGHNGAGKTTTMSILTGLFPPTNGTAYIYGHDIRSDIDSIRTSLGMCPQHNVLFDLLTVEEHVWFYASLKGRTSKEVKLELPQMIKDVGLPNKQTELSKNLSGGMKRKLSVAIAFVGGSQTVILDEPTAGVDPYARRAIWELLLKFRANRTIILSTHHMDEADILGDRIAIISNGKLCCCGSSLFLKNRFGSGYYLTLVRADTEETSENDFNLLAEPLPPPSLSRPSTAGSLRSTIDVMPVIDNDDEGYDEKVERSSSSGSDSPTLPSVEATMIPGFSKERITAFIQKFVQDAKLVEDNTIELCYQLPEEAAHAGDFENLFSSLERCCHDLGISSFGISDTSLEEVFLKVTDETNIDEPTDEIRRNKLEEEYDGGKYPRPVTRLSFRGKKRFGVFPLKQSNRVNSTEDLMQDSDFDDTESLSSDMMGNEFNTHGEVKLSGWSLIRKQFMALFIKRFHHVRRSKKGFICEVILPAGFVCLAMIFALILPPFKPEPELELFPWHYVPEKGDPNLFMFYSNDAPGNTLADSLQSTLLNKPWVGTRCMNSSIYTIDGFGCNSDQKLSWSPRPKLTGNLSVDSPDCSCETGIQSCPEGAGGPTPSVTQLPTTDYLYNMTGRNISDWLVKTMMEYRKKRYGGLSFGDTNPLAVLNSTQLINIIDRLSRAANNGSQVISGNETIWADLEDLAKRFTRQDVSKVWFNNKGFAASVAYMNVMNNLILRSYLSSDKDPSNFGITTINHPMNYTKSQLEDEVLLSGAVDVVVAICVIFAMSFIPASFILFLIEERVSNSKHLQFVSGINPAIYWIANFAWDMMNYLIPAILCLFIFLAFNKQAYVSATNAPCLMSLLFLYGWAIIPMMYPFCRIFHVPSSAFVFLSCVNVFLGTVSTLATFILEIMENDDQELADVNKVLKQVFLLLPHYCLGRGLIDMTANQLRADIIAKYGETYPYNIFAWNIVGRNLFSMAMLGLFFFILNLLIEYRFFIKPRKIAPATTPLDNEDIDVARERRRVLSGGADSDIIKLENLTKVYSSRGRKGRMTAVDRLCVGVPKGQCFGLLGVNGAGKTTAFKMLTGDLGVTSGTANINDFDIQKNIVKVRQHLGYCPQFDALDSLLTGREHLQFYCRLRGVPEQNVKSVSEWAIRKLGLLPYADKIAGSYSGGNKRKLSTAIALIGNPKIIFLDEPTTGMDPKARRFLWNCINSIVKDGRSVVLTSHSMEECEALCGRLAIMVNGRFKCIGSTQHLKNRFGNGYTIILRVSGENPNLDPVKQFITESFPTAVLKESHHNMLQYQLGSVDVSLAKLFGKMESAKADLSVEDYSVSQTTLDQVFINFAKLQTDMDDDIDDLPPDMAPRAYSDENGASQQLEFDFDEQSVTGSTLGLIDPDSARSSMRSERGRIPMTDVSVA